MVGSTAMNPSWQRFNKAQHHFLGMTNAISVSVARIAED